jgi:hypothetical protein
MAVALDEACAGEQRLIAKLNAEADSREVLGLPALTLRSLLAEHEAEKAKEG